MCGGRAGSGRHRGGSAIPWLAGQVSIEVEAGTAAALGAAVFAAQMFNVQVLPFSSAHLIGGVLLAWMLGPAIGLLTMTGISRCKPCSWAMADCSRSGPTWSTWA